ncbi:hypothetical protein C0991_004827 [Blastosporella zonata]|nr:hypothetical protein C0991_004827 [Blastosporella zonata]
MLKRDFLSILPPELALHILGFVDNPVTLLRTSAVSRTWRALAVSEGLWKQMCIKWGFGAQNPTIVQQGSSLTDEEPLEEMEPFAALPMDPALTWLTERKRRLRRAASDSSSLSDVSLSDPFSYYVRFKEIYNKILRWKRGGCLLRTHRLPMLSASVEQPLPVSLPSTSPKPRVKGASSTKNEQPDSGVVTSIALDNDWVVVGLVSSRIHVFSARTGVLARTLVGHGSGVWGLSLVSASPRNKSKGKARDKERGDNAPSAELPSLNFGGGSWKSTSRRTDANGVTGSRDGVIRTWDIQRGIAVHVLSGHSDSIRSLDVNGRRAVSGSYDTTCRIWDLDTGQCLHVLQGHFQRIYAVAFDGVLVVTGSLDTTVRVWNAETGHCIALLQQHIALVCHIQLSRKQQLLITGDSDGRVIAFPLSSSDSVTPAPVPFFSREETKGKQEPLTTKTRMKRIAQHTRSIRTAIPAVGACGVSHIAPI